MSDNPDRLLRIAEVKGIVGLGHTSIYARIAAGEFPRPIKVGSRTLWSYREVQDWIVRQLRSRAA
ncbi:helix-turn-helix transcriptional regulator [Bauldia litoralis]|uniref:Transcriptional regulator, AlpA family n=1 Tax=Bauldia litoralis TaxID=665467 RepID=A0A1G6A5M7_9HYPH|nr:AlpA family phage regulatory protein [Bauldia litoralis]SDB03718.1 transcriptional regulator, AlpA family [Bauldia litoralis]